jgi:hypothetical protein
MNKARLKILIDDLRAAEKEILLSEVDPESCEQLGELKSAIDDFRLTVWSSMVHNKAGQKRDEFVQHVRMSRVVEMLRQLGSKTSVSQSAPGSEGSGGFADLLRMADSVLAGRGPH